MMNYSIRIIILLSFLILDACNTDVPGIQFEEAPEEYRLKEVLSIDSFSKDTLLTKFTYNEKGLLDTIWDCNSKNPSYRWLQYDENDRLILSDWPGRIYNVAYTFDSDNQLTWYEIVGGETAVDDPLNRRWELTYNEDGQLNQITNYSGGSDFQQEVTYHNRSIQIGNDIYTFDNLHTPYPKAFRIQFSFALPLSIWLEHQSVFFTDHNIKSIESLYSETGETVSKIDFVIDYNEYGYPNKISRSDNNWVYFFNYEVDETL